MKFEEIKEESSIMLAIQSKNKRIDLGAVVKKHLGQNLSLIELNYVGEKRLHFENVQLDVLIYPDDAVPIVFRNAKIINHKNSYILQTKNEGVKSNRRGSFRVSVSGLGWLSLPTQNRKQVIIKNVSMTGFAITDRKKELNLSMGTHLSLFFEDISFKLHLEGKVVRIEETEDYVVYGMTILNICKDLHLYINAKQRKARK